MRKMTATNPIEEIQALGEELYQLRRTIAEKEEEFKAILAEDKKRRDLLQEELMHRLREHKMTSIKTESGDSFARAKRRSIAVSNMNLAIRTAMKLGAVTPDLKKLGTMLSKEEKLPKGFERVETEYISVRKAKA